MPLVNRVNAARISMQEPWIYMFLIMDNLNEIYVLHETADRESFYSETDFAQEPNDRSS